MITRIQKVSKVKLVTMIIIKIRFMINLKIETIKKMLAQEEKICKMFLRKILYFKH
jgi:hypothetical protein